MEVYYVNHKGQKIDLGRPPCQLQIENIRDYSRKYEGKNNKISRIYSEVTTMQANVTIEAENESEFYDIANYFFEITETDTAEEVQGKLYVGDYYLLCNVIASNKAYWNETFRGMDNEVKLLVPYPFWCREVNMVFRKREVETVRDTTEYLFYPVPYPYRYSIPRHVTNFENEHYAACDFRMTIYGPCENPAIRINGHLHEVKVSLLTGDYLQIDSRDGTVIQYRADGMQINVFNQRNKVSDLFKKIPAGQNSVSWATSEFGFDLTVFQERSEPKWTL